MIKRTMTSLLLLGMILTGCTMELVPVMPEQGNGPESLSGEGTVRFTAVQVAETRSSISIDENRLADVNIYAYCNGMLYAHAYSTTPETVSVKLKKGTEYNLYAVANTSEMSPLQKESDFIEQFKITLKSINDLGGKNLLAWSHKGFVLSSSAADINMEMSRLYSKVHFKLDKGVLKGLEVKSVKLCQAAKAVYPFQETGSRPSSMEEVMDGDYASAADLEQLNTTGEGIFFYTLENRQGSLLPTNTDPWKKTPENIPGKDKVCTYIEVTASFKEGFFYSGNVTYRFYLGQDNTSNFDVIRNNDTSVLLTLSGDNYGESEQDMSWKVILDTGMKREGYANYHMGKHVHEDNTLCVTERFEFVLTLKEELFNHFDRDMSNFYISAIDPVTEQKVNDIISLTSLTPVQSKLDENQFRCIGTVMKLGKWKYGLFDKRNDKMVSIINNENSTMGYDESKRPFVILSGGDKEYFSSKTALLNGPEVVWYLYSLDGDLRNPNDSGYEDYTATQTLNRKNIFSAEEGNSIDLSFYENFDFGSTIGQIAGDKNIIVTRYEPVGAEEDVPYVGRVYFKIQNDGISNQDLLIDLVTSWEKDFSVYPIDTKDLFDVYRSHNGLLNVEPIETRAVFERGENRWGLSRYSCGYVLRVKNTSRLPLSISSILRVPESQFHILDLFPSSGGADDQAVIGYILKGEDDCRSMALNFNEMTTENNVQVSGSCEFHATDQYMEFLLAKNCFRSSVNGMVADLDFYFKKSDGSLARHDQFTVMPFESFDSSTTIHDPAYHILRSGFDKANVIGGDHGLLSYEDPYSPQCLKFVSHDEWRELIMYSYLHGPETLTFDKQGLHLNNQGRFYVTLRSHFMHLTYKKAASKYISTYFNPSDKSHTNINSKWYGPNALIGEWETIMNKYHTKAYRQDYWHTAIHTKAGHHVVHPFPDVVCIDDIRFKIPGTPDWGETLYIGPCFNWKYFYNRDNIDKDSEKNDDSEYNYQMEIKFDERALLHHGIYLF